LHRPRKRAYDDVCEVTADLFLKFAGWTGMLAPAGTSGPVLDKLEKELIAALKKPDVKELFNTLAFTPAGETRDEFRRFMISEIAKWGKAEKDSGTKIH